MRTEQGIQLPKEYQHTFTIIIPDENDSETAQKISQWTKQYGHMLPKEPYEIQDYFKKRNSVVLALSDKTPVSHTAITSSYPDNWHEIGSVVTDIAYRHLKAGTTAVREVIRITHQRDPDAKLFALANASSAPLFEKMGGKKMRSIDLPQEVWKPCKDCPNYKLQKKGEIFVCCDTPYNLTEINGFKR